MDDGKLSHVMLNSVQSSKLVFDESRVIAAINKLKDNLSAGPDAIPPLFFKHHKYCLAKSLALLFTQMLSGGFVPSDWLRAIIVPVFKKGSAGIATNYRPMSLTCVASKVMERIIAKALLQHIVKNDLLSSAQHGFLKGKSTCTNLLKSHNDWTLSLQNKHGVTVVYIDFSKAVDSVSHKKLFVHLAQYGICGNLLTRLENFFTERSH